MPRYWTCPCGTRNERIKQKCANLECRRKRPKGRTKVLAHPQDDYLAVYVPLARNVHGVTDESCCICGRPRAQEKRHDRDHDHKTGLARGIVCYHCNKELLRHATLELAELVVSYLRRVDAYYSGSPQPVDEPVDAVRREVARGVPEHRMGV